MAKTIVTNPLFHACKSGRLDDVKSVILKDPDFSSGLLGACQEGHEDIFKFLLATSGKVSVKGLNDGLYIASRYGFLEVVKCLVSKGATDFGNALYGARRGGHNQIVQYLESIWEKISKIPTKKNSVKSFPDFYKLLK